MYWSQGTYILYHCTNYTFESGPQRIVGSAHLGEVGTFSDWVYWLQGSYIHYYSMHYTLESGPQRIVGGAHLDEASTFSDWMYWLQGSCILYRSILRYTTHACATILRAERESRRRCAQQRSRHLNVPTVSRANTAHSRRRLWARQSRDLPRVLAPV